MITYPTSYLQCPVCKVESGRFCRALSGAVVAGRPDGTIKALDRPHKARRVSKRA